MFFILLTLCTGDYLKSNYIVPSKLNSNAVGFVLDSNWRWVRNGNSNCFAGNWVGCSSPSDCYKCVVEGVPPEDYIAPYGVHSDGNKIQLDYVTKGPYSTNYGSRLYMVTGSEYTKFDLANKEFSFDIDVSNLPCGLNAAIYFVPLHPISDKGGALFGTGYGDAQCPKDIQFLQGFANTNNTGNCLRELDIWEGNSQANAFTIHNCKKEDLCKTGTDCGDGTNRYKSFCDKDGADYNPQRQGIVDKYGSGDKFAINTLLPFTVKTKFVMENNKLKYINRTFVQASKIVDGGYLSDESIAAQKLKFNEMNYNKVLGGMSGFDLSNLNLVISLWDDNSAQMAWLDGVFPPGSVANGDKRGPCPAGNRSPSYLRDKFPNSKVIISNFKLLDIAAQPIVKSVVFSNFCEKYEIKCV